MYGYVEHIEITPEQILQKVTQQEIHEWVLQQPFQFGDRYCSPFREDSHPGCRFEEREDGAILFVDFGERLLSGHTHRSCFGMVMDRYNVTMDGAIRKICENFRLSVDSKDYQLVNKIVYERTTKSISTEMTYEKKPYYKLDVIYWSQFLIKTPELISDNVHNVDWFTLRNHKGYRKITAYKYCYCMDFVDRLKIYQPYSDKYKWITNCDENNIGNFDNLPASGRELIVQKSYKDHRVLRNLDWGLDVVWFQNEGCVPSIEILKNLTERFEYITYFYDNDEDGIAAAKKLMDITNAIRQDCARVVVMPRRRKHKQLFGNYLKDPSEFIHREGRHDLITALKSIGIHGKNP